MSDASALKPILARLADGATLSESEAEQAFELLMSGGATPSQIGALLMALRLRGETVAEITGAARVMRAKAVAISAPDTAVDTCGTGGDGSGTYNISTAAALVTAACGVPVAKHGNRAASSKSGSADVLAALGVNLDAPMAVVERALADAGICFMMAPRHHAAIKHVMASRIEMGTRTIFNLLGPLANPAGTKRQVIGVFAERWVEPLAEVLGRLGSTHAWVVHGHGGLDELSTTGPSTVAAWRDGTVSRFTVDPARLGLRQPDPGELLGGDAATNAAALRALLDGDASAYRDIVLLNAAAALVVADAAADLTEGLTKAAAAVDRGAARETLAQLVAITNSEATA